MFFLYLLIISIKGNMVVLSLFKMLFVSDRHIKKDRCVRGSVGGRGGAHIKQLF